MTENGSGPVEIGVIADTHGLMRPEALEALAGVELIIHAGDVGGTEILEALEAIAPVRAVRGNMDRGRWAEALPHDCIVEANGVRIYVLHILEDLSFDLEAAGFDAVIFGHTHRPKVDGRTRVLYLNPGSAGPPRVDLPVTVARLTVGAGGLEAEIVDVG